MLIVFCMLLVPSVQVKHQGSNQSPRLSGVSKLDEQLLTCYCIFVVSIPSRSSFKVQVEVHGFQVKLQGSGQGPRFSDRGPRFQYPIHPGKASMFRSPSYGHSFYLLLVSAIQVKCEGPDFPAMGIAIDVRRQGSDLPAMVLVIQVNQQDSDLLAMVIAIYVKRPGSDLPTMFTAIRVKRQGPNRPSMVIAIHVKHQEPDPLSMVIVINVKQQGPDQLSMVIVSSYPRQASRFRSPSYGYSTSVQSSRSSGKDPIAWPWVECSAIDIRRQGCDLPAKCSVIQVNQQNSDLPSMCSANHVKCPGSHLPAMVIDCSVIQIKHLGSDCQSMVIVSSHPGQASRFQSPSYGYSVQSSRSSIQVLIANPWLKSPAIQVKHQGSTRPSMVCSAIQVKHQGSDRPSKIICSVIQVKHQGPYRLPMSPAIQVKHQDSDRPCMVIAIQVKHHGSDRPSMVIVIHVKHQGSDHPSMPPAIQVKHEGPDLPSMVIVVQVKVQGFDCPSMCSVIHVKHQGSDHPSMVIAIQIKCQGPDHPSMVISIKQHYGHILTSCNILLVFSHPGQASRFWSPRHDLIYLQSPAIQVKHQDSDLPAMGIVLNPPRSCFMDPDSVRGYRPNSKDQNSNLGYSSNIKDLISNQGYGYTLFSLSLHAFFRIGLVCLRSGYTMKKLFSFQCDRYIHLVRPLVTVGFISLLASQSKPAIMDPISVQCYSVLAVKVPLLSMPMIPNPSPIQSDRATIKDSISIQYDSQGQSIQVYCPLGQTELPKFYYLPSARAEANDQSFDILLGSQQAFNAQLYIKGRRYTRIFKQFTKKLDFPSVYIVKAK
ncbi:hypothetical protein PHYBLDRAFT_186315 [Phycomyces blakesleeanus NRRL 1555(-)]|uniref:Uncharacterized protein n=1 Tax=Phycomyces blakesleeanus (strain ATCC 8743b / DSM 1359 / FGSC 10004 / NBRC 33097 / NRRL 1555) TaxID=763407 RepID=A0A163AR28_PHYB8|nr:hypothetical protein PHYBLDRAFT_186315 [Phycomyces blakesleeanus NRRL 1555(-)]OAD75191.1 hypothetical protein PHYBLDRAFT_186315 [Phycomyces blakesleeanus NRRL 1555(-)]|eukprot:XP_018293231.1 hypothetical protein PHYBLDRAFT_186315 [Phycomyces blakesleeanus NRRL 1555(-)]